MEATKRRLVRIVSTWLTGLSTTCSMFGADILIEAEAFRSYGGWILDAQFVDQMGSPYLLAHGLGRPVANARTTIELPKAGDYQLWVRAKDWVPSHHSGRFRVLINGKTMAVEFGASGKDWSWQTGGQAQVGVGASGDRTQRRHRVRRPL